MKQSTTCANVANRFFTVLQRYTKGIRFTAILTLLFTICVGQMWAAPSARYYLIGEPAGNNWNKSETYKIKTWYNKDGQYILYS